MPLETQQPAAVINKIMAQTSKPELSQYLHAELFIPNTESLVKATKQGLLKMWTGLTKKLIKRHLEKSRNTKMGHLHTRRKGLQ